METILAIPSGQVIRLRRFISDLPGYWLILILGLLSATILLWGLGSASLYNWDEAIFAQVSKEILQTGDWITMHYEYKTWIYRSPLLMWIMALFYKLFGVTEFWSRAPSAFSGVGLVIITHLIGKSVYDKYTGFLAAVILLTSNQFVHSSRSGMTDVMLTFFIFLAIYAYLRLEEGNQAWWYLIWGSCALAVMTKTTAAFVSPAAITLALLLKGRLMAAIRSRQFWLGVLIAVAILAPWHIAMLIKHGHRFINDYFIFNTIGHMNAAVDGLTGGRFFYIERLQTEFHPWYYLLPFALALCVHENIVGQSRSRILLLVIVLVFGLYTLARTKLPWYIVPLYPPFAILTASLITRAFRCYKSVSFSAVVVATAVVALAASRSMALMLGGVMACVFLLSLLMKRFAYELTAVVMCGFCVGVGLHEVRQLYVSGDAPDAKVARLAHNADPGDREPLILYPTGRPGPTPRLWRPVFLFYSDRPIQEAYSLDDLAAFTGDHETKRIVLVKDEIESLPRSYEISIVADDDPFVYATIKLN